MKVAFAFSAPAGSGVVPKHDLLSFLESAMPDWREDDVAPEMGVKRKVCDAEALKPPAW